MTATRWNDGERRSNITLRATSTTTRLQYAIVFLLVLANVLSSQSSWLQEISLYSRSLAMIQTNHVVVSDASNTTTTRLLTLLSAGSAAEITQPPVHHAVHDNSSWIGNQWIPPPGFRLYTVTEMQDFFSKTHPSILFIGDSSARRAYATFSAILNATTTTTSDSNNNINNNIDAWDIDAEHIIDVNKHTLTEVCTTKNVSLCRRLTIPSHHQNENDVIVQLDYQSKSCPEIIHRDIEQLLLQQQHQQQQDDNNNNNYSLVVISIGAWHLMMKCKSKRMDNFRALIWKLETLLLSQQQQQQSNNNNTNHNGLTIVWVTMGSIGHEHDINGKRTYKRAHDINRKIRQHIMEQQQLQQQTNFSSNSTTNHNNAANTLTVLDWGSVMQPRSWPYQDRIKGDIAPHYGLEARLVLLQMLMNHLIHRRDRSSSSSNGSSGNNT